MTLSLMSWLLGPGHIKVLAHTELLLNMCLSREEKQFMRECVTLEFGEAVEVSAI